MHLILDDPPRIRGTYETRRLNLLPLTLGQAAKEGINERWGHAQLSLCPQLYFYLFHAQESSDNCQWYAARASKEPLSEASVQPNTRVVSQSGHISEVNQGKGVILFNFYDEVGTVGADSPSLLQMFLLWYSEINDFLAICSAFYNFV